MDNRPIGVFDSGVGGLSILREVKKLLPRENFVFVADQKNVPYGRKSQKQLRIFAKRIADFLINREKVKTIIIACNTSTVYTINYLRSIYSVPIIGTVPVVKTIAGLSKTKKTAVFSTPATAKSRYLDNLIQKFAKGVVVYKVGGTGLEELIEANSKEKELDKVLRKFLSPLISSGVDAVALGCTHYPFVRSRIQKIVGKNVRVVDSGGAVARRTREVLVNNRALGTKRLKDLYYTTGDPTKFKEVAEILLGKKINNICSLNI